MPEKFDQYNLTETLIKKFPTTLLWEEALNLLLHDPL